MRSKQRTMILATLALAVGLGVVVAEAARAAEPNATLFADGLQGAAGSTIGPGRDLYVTEGATGRLTRVDRRSGEKTTVASGLPVSIIGIGGAVDVAFLDDTAYVLVTLVGPDVGGSDTVGIYRVDGPDTFTVIADIGEFSINNPPATPFFIPTGVQYALETFRGGFLVSDGHHNRVLRITLDGQVSELETFGNVVPTGLETIGHTIFATQAGPVPHLPETGKVVAFGRPIPGIVEVASGAMLAVDVELGRSRTLYALSQGLWNGAFEGSPALPNTGALMEVNWDGTMSTVIDGLNQPTSFELMRNTAYVVTLGGEIWKIEGI
jgi:hypothetical protein